MTTSNDWYIFFFAFTIAMTFKKEESSPKAMHLRVVKSTSSTVELKTARKWKGFSSLYRNQQLLTFQNDLLSPGICCINGKHNTHKGLAQPRLKWVVEVRGWGEWWLGLCSSPPLGNDEVCDFFSAVVLRLDHVSSLVCDVEFSFKSRWVELGSPQVYAFCSWLYRGKAFD